MDILEKDIKMVTGTSMTIAMATVTTDMKDLLIRPNFRADLQQFSFARNVDVVVIMSACDGDDDKPRRQIAVFSENRIFKTQIVDSLDNCSEVDLELDPWDDTPFDDISVFSQGNVDASRQKVLPVLKSFLHGDLTPDVGSKEFVTQNSVSQAMEGFSSFSSVVDSLLTDDSLSEDKNGNEASKNVADANANSGSLLDLDAFDPFGGGTSNGGDNSASQSSATDQTRSDFARSNLDMLSFGDDEATDTKPTGDMDTIDPFALQTDSNNSNVENIPKNISHNPFANIPTAAHVSSAYKSSANSSTLFDFMTSGSSELVDPFSSVDESPKLTLSPSTVADQVDNSGETGAENSVGQTNEAEDTNAVNTGQEGIVQSNVTNPFFDYEPDNTEMPVMEAEISSAVAGLPVMEAEINSASNPFLQTTSDEPSKSLEKSAGDINVKQDVFGDTLPPDMASEYVMKNEESKDVVTDQKEDDINETVDIGKVGHDSEFTISVVEDNGIEQNESNLNPFSDGDLLSTNEPLSRGSSDMSDPNPFHLPLDLEIAVQSQFEDMDDSENPFGNENQLSVDGLLGARPKARKSISLIVEDGSPDSDNLAELNESDFFDKVITPEMQTTDTNSPFTNSGDNSPFINTGVPSPFDNWSLSHSKARSDSGSGFPSVSTPPNSLMDSGFDNMMNRDHALPSFNNVEMVQRIHQKKASLGGGADFLGLDDGTDSMTTPYTPQNSYREEPGAYLQQDTISLPSFNNSSMVQRIHEKRASLSLGANFKSADEATFGQGITDADDDMPAPEVSVNTPDDFLGEKSFGASASASNAGNPFDTIQEQSDLLDVVPFTPSNSFVDQSGSRFMHSRGSITTEDLMATFGAARLTDPETMETNEEVLDIFGVSDKSDMTKQSDLVETNEEVLDIFGVSNESDMTKQSYLVETNEEVLDIFGVLNERDMTKQSDFGEANPFGDIDFLVESPDTKSTQQSGETNVSAKNPFDDFSGNVMFAFDNENEIKDETFSKDPGSIVKGNAYFEDFESVVNNETFTKNSGSELKDETIAKETDNVIPDELDKGYREVKGLSIQDSVELAISKSEQMEASSSGIGTMDDIESRGITYPESRNTTDSESNNDKNANPSEITGQDISASENISINTTEISNEMLDLGKKLADASDSVIDKNISNELTEQDLIASEKNATNTTDIAGEILEQDLISSEIDSVNTTNSTSDTIISNDASMLSDLQKQAQSEASEAVSKTISKEILELAVETFPDMNNAAVAQCVTVEVLQGGNSQWTEQLSSDSGVGSSESPQHGVAPVNPRSPRSPRRPLLETRGYSVETDYLPNMDPFHGNLNITTSPSSHSRSIETDADKEVVEGESFRKVSGDGYGLRIEAFSDIQNVGEDKVPLESASDRLRSMIIHGNIEDSGMAIVDEVFMSDSDVEMDQEKTDINDDEVYVNEGFELEENVPSDDFDSRKVENLFEDALKSEDDNTGDIMKPENTDDRRITVTNEASSIADITDLEKPLADITDPEKSIADVTDPEKPLDDKPYTVSYDLLADSAISLPENTMRESKDTENDFAKKVMSDMTSLSIEKDSESMFEEEDESSIHTDEANLVGEIVDVTDHDKGATSHVAASLIDIGDIDIEKDSESMNEEEINDWKETKDESNLYEKSAVDVGLSPGKADSQQYVDDVDIEKDSESMLEEDFSETSLGKEDMLVETNNGVAENKENLVAEEEMPFEIVDEVEESKDTDIRIKSSIKKFAEQMVDEEFSNIPKILKSIPDAESKESTGEFTDTKDTKDTKDSTLLNPASISLDDLDIEKDSESMIDEQEEDERLALDANKNDSEAPAIVGEGEAHDTNIKQGSEVQPSNAAIVDEGVVHDTNMDKSSEIQQKPNSEFALIEDDVNGNIIQSETSDTVQTNVGSSGDTNVPTDTVETNVSNGSNDEMNVPTVTVEGPLLGLEFPQSEQDGSDIRIEVVDLSPDSCSSSATSTSDSDTDLITVRENLPKESHTVKTKTSENHEAALVNISDNHEEQLDENKLDIFSSPVHLDSDNDGSQNELMEATGVTIDERKDEILCELAQNQDNVRTTEVFGDVETLHDVRPLTESMLTAQSVSSAETPDDEHSAGFYEVNPDRKGDIDHLNELQQFDTNLGENETGFYEVNTEEGMNLMQLSSATVDSTSSVETPTDAHATGFYDMNEGINVSEEEGQVQLKSFKPDASGSNITAKSATKNYEMTSMAESCESIDSRDGEKKGFYEVNAEIQGTVLQNIKMGSTFSPIESPNDDVVGISYQINPMIPDVEENMESDENDKNIPANPFSNYSKDEHANELAVLQVADSLVIEAMTSAIESVQEIGLQKDEKFIVTEIADAMVEDVDSDSSDSDDGSSTTTEGSYRIPTSRDLSPVGPFDADPFIKEQLGDENTSKTVLEGVVEDIELGEAEVESINADNSSGNNGPVQDEIFEMNSEDTAIMGSAIIDSGMEERQLQPDELNGNVDKAINTPKENENLTEAHDQLAETDKDSSAIISDNKPIIDDVILKESTSEVSSTPDLVNTEQVEKSQTSHTKDDTSTKTTESRKMQMQRQETIVPDIVISTETESGEFVHEMELDSSKLDESEENKENQPEVASGGRDEYEIKKCDDDRSQYTTRREIFFTSAGRMSISIDSVMDPPKDIGEASGGAEEPDIIHEEVEPPDEEDEVEVEENKDSTAANKDAAVGAPHETGDTAHGATGDQTHGAIGDQTHAATGDQTHGATGDQAQAGKHDKLKGMEDTQEWHEDPIPGMGVQEDVGESESESDSDSDSEYTKPVRPDSLLSGGKRKKKIAANTNMVSHDSTDDLVEGVDELATPDDLETPDDMGGELEWEDDTPITPQSETKKFTEYHDMDDDEERDQRENKQFRKVLIAGKDYKVDMHVIEPYKKVLSHGGYYGDGLNAIILFCGCYLPDRGRRDYQYVMDNLFLYVISTLELLVAEDYMIVYFHGATPRRQMPSFGWLKRCYQMIDRRLRKNLKALLLVHPTLWLKTVVVMTKPFISSKFSSKLRFVKTLQELGKLVPMEYIYVPDPVTQYDGKLTYCRRPSSSSSSSPASPTHPS